MSTMLEMGKDGVNILCLYDMTRYDIRYLNAWLFALGLNETERKSKCSMLFEDGELLFSNLKHHLTIHCRVRA